MPTANQVVIKRRLFGNILRTFITLGLILLVVLIWWLNTNQSDNLILAVISVVLTLLLIALWFVMPKGVGRKEPIANAKRAKEREVAKWGFHSRDREGPWLNYFEGPLIVKTDIDPKTSFFSDWCIIQDGYVIVNPGRGSIDKETNDVTYDLDRWRTYAWDGCTPKAWFFWFILIGTPDWYSRKLEGVTVWYDADKEVHYPCRRTYFWPMAHKASVVHDALYQFLDNIPITKNEVDKLFHQLLLESNMPRLLSYGYYLAVKYFGARSVKQVRLSENSPYHSSTYSDLLKTPIVDCH